jgi:3-oxoacyl-[acyl-carrier-protein] synthase II
MTAPDPTGAGAARAVAVALAAAGRQARELTFVNAHGTGTPLNDAAEWRGLQRALGSVAEHIPLTSIKGSVGHLLGSAGAIEAVATVLSLVHRTVPPTAGRGEIDPTIGVDLVVGSPRAVPAGPALSLNLAFGGCNAALVLEPWTG